MSLLEGELAEIIGDALIAADIPYGMTIPRQTAGAPRPDDWPTWEPWPDDTVTIEHTVQGFIDTYSAFLVASGVVNAGDVKIVLIQTTLPFRPELTDVIVARGKTYTILSMSEDPAKATLEVRAKV